MAPDSSNKTSDDSDIDDPIAEVSSAPVAHVDGPTYIELADGAGSETPAEEQTARKPDRSALTLRRLGMWGHLDELFVLVAVRPKLAHDVRIRRNGDTIEMVHLSTGRFIVVGDDELRLVRQFDGTRTIYEVIVNDIGEERRLAIDLVLGVVDRVVRAEMLESFPPSMFRQIEVYLAKRALTMARNAAKHNPVEVDVNVEPVSNYEQVPWRPRSPMLAERAQFLRNVDLLKQLDLATIGQLAEVAHEEAFPAASNIITQGQRPDRFYIIKSGEANVIRDVDGVRERVAKLETGDYFGETGLLESSLRDAAVRSGPSRPLIALTFDSVAFERIISPSVSQFRGRHVLARRREKLENIHLFSHLDTEDLERLAHAVHEHRVPEGTVVFKQGELGDSFYILVEGEVRVIKDGVPVAVLSEGDFFGETSLLFTEERTATIETTTDSTLWTLDKDAFQHMVRDHMLGRRELMPTILNRLHGQP